MKLLVLSDSHGREEKIEQIILEHKDADAIIFLGDGEMDFENALAVCGIGINSPVITCQVRGNCDLSSREPDTILREFGGVRFLITHGHVQNVKCGRWSLLEEAKRKDCQAALFGHTHMPHFSEKEGVTLINPGSVYEGSYCLLEVTGGVIRKIS